MADPDLATAKGKRDWVRQNSHACPCCGGALLVMIDGDERVQAFMEELARIGAKLALAKAEDVEDMLEARPFEYVCG